MLYYLLHLNIIAVTYRMFGMSITYNDNVLAMVVVLDLTAENDILISLLQKKTMFFASTLVSFFVHKICIHVVGCRP